MHRLAFIILALAASALSQWEPDVQATNYPGSGKSITAEPAATAGSYVYLVWDDSRDPSTHETYFKRSTDDGATWLEDVRLTPADAYWSPCAAIAAQGAEVHVVWHELRHTSAHPTNEEVYYLRSTDSGATWGAEQRLTDDTSHSWHPRIALEGDFVHVVWADYRTGTWQVWYKRSTDRGATWGADNRLSNGTGIIEVPEVAVAGENVHVVWQDSRHGTSNHEVYYARSTDNGATWLGEARLTNEPHESYAPVVAASGELVHVVWVDYRDLNSEVYYKRSTDAGATWGQDTDISNTGSSPGPYSTLPSVAASGDLVHVVWGDDFDGNNEIYYRKSQDRGSTWLDRVRLTNEPSVSVSPVVMLADSEVKVVWPDMRAGANYELFYKRNPTGNLVAVAEPPAGPAIGSARAATICRDVLWLPRDMTEMPGISDRVPRLRAVLRDASGRKVADLVPGPNDFSHLAPGIYFVHQASGVRRDAAGVTKVVLTK